MGVVVCVSPPNNEEVEECRLPWRSCGKNKNNNNYHVIYVHVHK